MNKRQILSHINTMSNQNFNKIAVLGALCIFLSTIEYMFPKPLPFLRLGLANIPLLLALNILNFQSYFLLVFIKLLGQALINGTLASYVFLFSVCGTFAAAIMMNTVYHVAKKNISYIGLSILGALAGNIIQIYLSVKIVFGHAAWKIFPAVLGLGLVSGFFIGFFAQYFAERSLWWQNFSNKKVDNLVFSYKELKPVKIQNKNIKLKNKKVRKDLIGNLVHPFIKFISGLLIIPVCFFEDDLLKKFIFFTYFIALNLLSGVKIRTTYLAVLLFSITFFNSLNPLGKVLIEWGPYSLTAGAIQASLVKALSLLSLILISQFSISKNLKFPGKLGGLLTKSFYFLEQLLDARFKMNKGNVFKSIDTLLMSTLPPNKIDNLFGNTNNKVEDYKRSSGCIYLLLIVTPVWLTFFLL